MENSANKASGSHALWRPEAGWGTTLGWGPGGQAGGQPAEGWASGLFVQMVSKYRDRSLAISGLGTVALEIAVGLFREECAVSLSSQKARPWPRKISKVPLWCPHSMGPSGQLATHRDLHSEGDKDDYHLPWLMEEGWL